MKRKASTAKNNGHAKFGPSLVFHSMKNLLTAVTFGYIDELERNVFLKIPTKILTTLEEARIVMWRWLMLTPIEKVMRQKLKSKPERVD